jgi:hypothetical protein
MPGEASIEHSVIRNRESVLGIRDSLYIRRCRMGPGFGVADLVILPQRGKHKLIIVEAKQASSADAKIKVLGQLLMYYAGALQFGLSGVRLLQQYAVKRHAHARSHHKSSLKAISGGVTPPEAAWARLQKGRRLRPDNIRLIAALDSEPGSTLKHAIAALGEHHGLAVDVVSVMGRDDLHLWHPGQKE